MGLPFLDTRFSYIFNYNNYFVKMKIKSYVIQTTLHTISEKNNNYTLNKNCIYFIIFLKKRKTYTQGKRKTLYEIVY